MALILVVLLPAGLFVASAVRLQADRQMVLEHQLAGLRQQTLTAAETPLAAWLDGQAAQLDQALARVALSTHELRQLVRNTPAARQVLVMDAQGQRLFPPPNEPLTGQEESFLERTRLLWRDHGILYPSAAEGQPPDRGWYTWYWGDEMNLIRWVMRENGDRIGMELEPARVAADLIGQLSGTAPGEALIRLRNERGQVLFQWGAMLPAPLPAPAAVQPLQPPLSAWRLEYLEPPQPGLAATPLWLLSLVAAGCLVMLTLAGYLYRAHRHEIAIAGQRVSFVNQVSHELKTPLTNIRMYSELLERELPDDETRARGYLAVVTAESERLSRLIANVLSFARAERSKLEVSPRPGSINQVVTDVLEAFAPILAEAGIDVQWQPGAGETAAIDSDAIGQILNNLVGNVEKYAAAGGLLSIRVSRSEDLLTLDVADRGPGVPAGQEESIFEAFYRVDDRLSGAASGTGIGLSVARELARLHGGDLCLVPAEAGACFRLTLHAPLLEAGA